jgi:hypothetical protein
MSVNRHFGLMSLLAVSFGLLLLTLAQSIAWEEGAGTKLHTETEEPKKRCLKQQVKDRQIVSSTTRSLYRNTDKIMSFRSDD